MPISIRPEERKAAYVLIDGGYIRGRIRELGKEHILSDVNKYARFLQLLLSEFSYSSSSGGIVYPVGEVGIQRVYYYDAIVPVEDDPDEHKRQREFFNKLQLQMNMCEVKLGHLIKTDKGFKQKGVDTLIAIDMLTKAYLNHYDVAYLIAGDGDFVSMVKAVKDYTGKIVIGIFEPTSASKELIRTFDLTSVIRKEKLKEICNKIITKI